MIYLEQIVNQILREEGQVIVTLEDLQITWEDLESLFIGIFEQASQYINIYDWQNAYLSQSPTKQDWTHIKHLTLNASILQRLMPDIPQNQYEFNPYTQEARTLMNAGFAVEAGLKPTLAPLPYETELDLIANQKQRFKLPCTFTLESFKFGDFEAFHDRKDKNRIILESNDGVGNFNTKTLVGEIIMDKDYKDTLSVTSKYVGIKELGLDCELFYTWFKAALMQYIGAMKKQLDLSGVGLPFDINADGLLERGRQLMDSVHELKGTESNWSNF